MYKAQKKHGTGTDQQRGVKATGYEAGADSKSIYGRRKTE